MATKAKEEKITKQNKQEVEKISVYIMGKMYKVPVGSTIMGALEYSGYQLKRGVGCREGFCGACATVYRTKDDYKFKTGLACQTVVQDGMMVAQMPFIPTCKPVYHLDELEPNAGTFMKLYPETFRCLSCNTCTKACPQEIIVMDYINAVERGDIELAASISFDCIRCGMCALRCPAEIAQFNVGMLARRLYGKFIAPISPDLEKRIQEITNGIYNEEMDKLKKMGPEELKKAYYARDIEPGEAA